MTAAAERDRQAVLITGASAGIGRELARAFARRGFRPVLVARREPALRSVAEAIATEFGIDCPIVPADLSDPGQARAIYDEITGRLGLDVDVLVNNAATLTGGQFHRMAAGDVEAMVDLNVRSLTMLTWLFVKPMIERGAGRILNVASTAALGPVADLAVYAASKAYVLSMSEALAGEVAGRGVTVTVVCPGYTDTDMLRTANLRDGRDIVVPADLIMSPERVAEEACAACLRGARCRILEARHAWVRRFGRLMPTWLYRRLRFVLNRVGR